MRLLRLKREWWILKMNRKLCSKWDGKPSVHGSISRWGTVAQEQPGVERGQAEAAAAQNRQALQGTAKQQVQGVRCTSLLLAHY
jgi:hypothetical protein